MKLTFTIYLLLASWQDLRKRQIKVWLYILFGIAGIVEYCLWGRTAESVVQTLIQVLTGTTPGLFLLLVTKCSRGAIGAGDGWFFVTAALYMEVWSVVALLFYGLIFCSACCLGMVVWGIVSGVNIRKRRLPFLPFLVPAWIWINILMG